ncbi:MAG: hypothetical protein IJA70_11270, partial [Oscillospiraceae bacterium]|nr:hypothetical protein [Oscillospiraceae bacterium]
MMKRGIAFILCLSMIFSFIVPVAFVFADTEVLSVEYDGSHIEDISINHDEKKVLSAVMGNYAPENCQWQILVDSENGIWADIYDKITAECEISYALVKNVMESSGEAFIRCKVMGEKGWVYSNSVSVSVYFKEAEEIPVEDPGLVLISDMEVLPPEEPVEEIPDEESEEISPEEPVEEVPGEEISGTFSVGEAARTLLADGDGGEEIKEYVNVTIHYLDAQSLKVGADQSIYKPYTARIEVGSDFIQTVLSPTYLGFAPYTNLQYSVVYGKDVYSGGEDATVIQYNETNVQEDIVKKVYYKPIEVPYGIRYMFQNINDDLYTERPDLYRLESAETGTI